MVSILGSIRKKCFTEKRLGIEIISTSVTLSAIKNFQHGTSNRC